MGCYHGITQGHLDIFDDWVCPAEWWASSWAAPCEGGVEARRSLAWVPGYRRHMGPKAPRRSFRIVVVRAGCSVRVKPCGANSRGQLLGSILFCALSADEWI